MTGTDSALVARLLAGKQFHTPNTPQLYLASHLIQLAIDSRGTGAFNQLLRAEEQLWRGDFLDIHEFRMILPGNSATKKAVRWLQRVAVFHRSPGLQALALLLLASINDNCTDNVDEFPILGRIRRGEATVLIARKALRLSSRSGNLLAFLTVAGFLAESLVQTGEHAEGHAVCVEIVAAARTHGIRLVGVHVLLGQLAHREGRFGDAERHLRVGYENAVQDGLLAYHSAPWSV